MKKEFRLKPTAQNRENVLEIYTSYNLGGMNYFNYKVEKRGYYIHVQPAEIKGHLRGYEYGKGHKILLKEVSRKSKKAEQEADTMAENMIEQLVKDACVRYGFILEDEVA